ncbi:hypothetical protein HK100_000904 [Physocladia obscura]|uniref:CBS domain-containing protein n=1 Tax=Physocladia obscura TaxID=109957 RepID=A0AAD5SXL7_9FUNG|nr:hypothetical protein HK100_000904 [Physocladia obscura]
MIASNATSSQQYSQPQELQLQQQQQQQQQQHQPQEPQQQQQQQANEDNLKNNLELSKAALLLSNDIKSIRAALDAIPISTLIAHLRSRQPDSLPLTLISVHENTPLSQVLRVLSENNILAVPVYRDSVDFQAEKVFTGIVSIYDVLAYTVFQKLFNDLENLETEVTSSSFQNVDKEAAEFFSTSVSVLLGQTAESAMSWTLHSSEPCSVLLQMITTPPYHRILVIDDDEAIRRVIFDEEDVPQNTTGCVLMITQRDLLEFIYTYRDTIQPSAVSHVLTTPVATIEYIAKQYSSHHNNQQDDANQIASALFQKPHVIKVPAECTALAAFRIMYMHRVSAVAITVSNTDPKIVANLSASDLRGITTGADDGDHVTRLEALLMLPVFEFLERVAGRRAGGQIAVDQLRTAVRADSFEHVVRTVLGDGIHRVWIEDGEEGVVGVLTVGDMLGVFRD